MVEHDGFLISSPEYNSSISAVLKNAIDWVSRPVPGEPPLVAFRGKVARLMSASPGGLGGLRGLVHLRSILGNIEANPFYLNCCQIAELAGIDFSVNCLYDSLGNIYDVLAGNPFDVHDVGIRKTVGALGIPVSERADITLVSSYPYNEGPQIVKPVLPAAMTTKPGGTILLVAEILAPLPEFFLDSFTKIRECGGADTEVRIKEKLLCVEPIIEGPMDFNMALILIFFASKKFRIVLVADRILQEAAGQMGFDYAPDLSVAIEKERLQRKTATVNLIPAGGYVFPIVKEAFIDVNCTRPIRSTSKTPKYVPELITTWALPSPP
jgi:hypothetical protein